MGAAGRLGAGARRQAGHVRERDQPPGGCSETEIILAYGACCFASKPGQLAGNHFLTIVEGREHLRALGTQVLREGAPDVLLEKP